MPFFLKSNAEFGSGNYHKYTQYPIIKNAEELEECTESISDEKQEELIEEARALVLEQLAEQQKKKTIKKDGEPETNNPLETPQESFASRLSTFLKNVFHPRKKGGEIERE